MAEPKSRIVLVGTNHKHASVNLRERLSIQPEELPGRLKSILHPGKGIKEAVVLSTCNRTEIYTITFRESGIREYLLQAMSAWSGIPTTALKECTYTLLDEEAVSHLFGVASGLDSMVVGEQQIRGQVREAAKVAVQAGAAGRFLTESFQRALRVADEVREECDLGSGGISVSSAAVSLLKKVSGNNPLRSILLVGAGKMITLAAGYLSTSSGTEVWIANRTIQRAEVLAKRVGGTPVAFNRIPEILEKADAVLSCTSSPTYVITKQLLEEASGKRAGRPLILIDAAVPRNIDPACSTISRAQLYNIDDLAPFIPGPNETQLSKANKTIQRHVESYITHLRAYDVKDTVKGLRKLAEQIREEEFSRALRKMGHLTDREKAILEILTIRIINKLLYEPTAHLIEHAGNGDGETYEAFVRELFAID